MTILAGIGGAIGSALSSVTVGGALAAASTAATIGTTIAQTTKKEPGAKIVSPPSITDAKEKAAQQVAVRRKRGQGFRDTILR